MQHRSVPSPYQQHRLVRLPPVICRLTASVVLIAGLLLGVEALACGVPGATPGAVGFCNLKDRPRDIQPSSQPTALAEASSQPTPAPSLSLLPWQLSAAYVFSQTTIRFGSEPRAAIDRQSLSSSADYRLRDNLSVQFMAGATLRGTINTGQLHGISPGPLAGLSISWQVLPQRRFVPFILLGATLSFTSILVEQSAAMDTRFTAFDARAGVIVGKTFGRFLTPYLVARAFGGPVYWQTHSAVGTDLYHYQVGAGLVVQCGKRVNLYAEGVPFGERAEIVGVGLAL